MGGLGVGPLFAGVVAQYLPAPLALCFVLDLLLVMAVVVVVWRAPETAELPERPHLRLQPLSVPPSVRTVFIPAAIAGFAGFAVLGLFTSVAPAVMGKLLHVSNHALTGLVVFVLFVASTAGQIGQSRPPERLRLPVGCVLLIVGIGFVAFAIGTASLALLVAGAVICGIGQGGAFRAGLGAITAATPPRRRAEVASTFFVVAYVAISIPVVGVGLLADLTDLPTAGISFSVVVALLSMFALVSLVVLRGRDR